MNNTGGPAFPANRDMRNSPDWDHEPGMTLRDYLAAHASDEDVKAQVEVLLNKRGDAGVFPLLPNDWRTVCRYMHADAMLKERAK